jgi:hypothetical protein
MLADVIRQLAGITLRDPDGNEEALELEPPATEDEIRALQSGLPCPIPADIQGALRVSKGISNGPLDSFSLVDLEGIGLEDIFPNAYSIGADGYGNFWVLDLLPMTTSWGPVFYVCHDPPVVAYQSATIEEFLNGILEMWKDRTKSQVDLVHEKVVHKIWRENPDFTTPEALQGSGDEALRGFAASLPPEALIADLRRPALGQGFSWGRFGPKTTVRRAGPERVWAVLPPERKPGLLGGLFRRKP